MADVANVGPSAQSIPVPRNAWDADMLYIHLLAKVEDLKAHMGDLRTSDLLALQAAFVAAEKSRDLALVSAEKAVGAALAAQEKAVAAALNAAEKATDKYEREVKEWRMASNEWRSAMGDREEKFIQKDHFHASFRALEASVHQMDGKLDDLTRSRDLAAGRQTAQTAILGFIFAAITIALRFV